MANKMPASSPQPAPAAPPAMEGKGPSMDSVTPPASVAAVIDRQIVEPGPAGRPRDASGRFASAPAPDKSAADAPKLNTVPAESPAELAERDKLYDIWPEKAEELWGPRKAKPEAKADEKKPEAKADEPAKKEQPKAQDAPKAEPAAQETVARDKAVKALKLDGFTDDDLKAMKPERVLALGQASIARHAAVDQRLASAGREPEQTASDEAGESALERQLPPELRPVVKELAEEFGSDKAGELLTRVIGHFSQKALTQELQAIDAELTQVRNGLREQFPGLKDNSVWSRVLDEVVDLRKTARYGAMPFADVIPVAYGFVVPAPTPEQVRADRVQTDGLPVAPPTTPPKATVSGVKKGDDPMRVIYDALRQGATKEQAAELGALAL